MTEYPQLSESLITAGLTDWANWLPEAWPKVWSAQKHGQLPTWLAHVNAIPEQATPYRRLDQDAVTIGQESELDPIAYQRLLTALTALKPWRKGPYQLYGITIDTEWRSDWKWTRVSPHISSLKNRLVLDVGCGNGYHCWRMLGAGARCVLGIEPFMLNVVQFTAIKKLYGVAPVHLLPFTLEELPVASQAFDTVFSMGVLYHRRSPIEHLLMLKEHLRPGGELVLETLVIDGNAQAVLLPEGRYANMRNVWFIPSCAALMLWLKRCGFSDCRLVDVTVTSLDEQRSTAWMPSQSLPDFLNPNDLSVTIEGLPAPKRAIVIANRT